MENRIKIGISACLMGENVRWNGGHSRDRYLTDILGQYVEYVPVCPEVECGMGVPRETLRLVGDPDNPNLVTSKTNIDHTQRMTEWARKRVKALEKENLCGFVFKKNSPSSGLFNVPVKNFKGMPKKKGQGIFARTFTQHFPLIPVEEDGRLHDAKLREMFIEQIFTLKRWREALSQRKSMGNLVNFHTRHKLLMMSHSPNHSRLMGKLVAGGKTIPVKELFEQYETLLMEALRLKTTQKKNVNVLQHIMGYFKRDLSADEKQELLEIVGQYRQEHVPLIVPVTLLNHYVRKYKQPYLAQQVYLNPHPIALKLRNHV
ncbi:YbgA family protein [Thermodesulfobacteriota bacterium]